MCNTKSPVNIFCRLGMYLQTLLYKFLKIHLSLGCRVETACIETYDGHCICSQKQDWNDSPWPRVNEDTKSYSVTPITEVLKLLHYCNYWITAITALLQFLHYCHYCITAITALLHYCTTALLQLLHYCKYRNYIN